MPAPKDPEKRTLWKQRLSQSHMGKQVNLGRVQSEATKAKISETLTGRKPSSERYARQLEGIQRHTENITPEQREKMGWSRGIPHTEEHNHRIGESNKGRVSPMKGKKFTEEEKATRYAFLIGKPAPNKGMPMPEHVKQLLFSPEITAKRAESYSKNFAAMTPEEKYARIGAWIEAGRNPKTQDTSIERFVAQQLDILQIAYEQQKHVGIYFVDFFIPEYRFILEVNGCYWHGCENCGFNEEYHVERRERDAERTTYLENLGYPVYTVWEHDLRPFMDS